MYRPIVSIHITYSTHAAAQNNENTICVASDSVSAAREYTMDCK